MNLNESPDLCVLGGTATDIVPRQKWEIVGEIAEDCPNWLKEFHKEFKQDLREREYIR